ncbi:MAG: glycosyltransferase family 2 protein [Acholeplasmatales bacterium]|nr:glycosyltransferase family 2 protein [Acholeplasmatales bacterium]
MKKISVIVPCYNEHETIEIFYNEIIKYFDDKYDYKIIFVNDGSKDNSLDIMRELGNKDSRVLYVGFSRNFGKEAAMYAGLEAAQRIHSDAALFMDVDLQDPPELLPEMLGYYEEGYNLIMTKQKDRKGQGLFGKMCSLGFYKVYAFVTKDKGMAKGSRDFCLMDKKVINAFLQIKDNERFTKGIFHYVGFKTKMIEFEYKERVAGTTKWNFRKLLKYAFLGMREFSRFYEYIPKIFAWIFALITLFDIGYGIGYAIYNDVNFFTEAMNWTNLRIDFGLTLLFIGIFYVIRLLYDVRSHAQKRPIYIEEESNIVLDDED